MRREAWFALVAATAAVAALGLTRPARAQAVDFTPQVKALWRIAACGDEAAVLEAFDVCTSEDVVAQRR